MNKISITIAVSGLNNTDIPAPGVPFIRGLKESEVFDARIVGLVYENLEPGIYMDDLCHVIYKIPAFSASGDGILDHLDRIHKQEQIDVLIHTSDDELLYYIKNQEQLAKMGIRSFLPTPEQFGEREKYRLPEFGRKYGIKVPQSLTLNSLGEITEMEDKFDYPVMIKGRYYEAYLAANKEQVKQAFLKISSKWGFPVIAQEFKPGTEINVVAVGDGNGNMLAAVPMRKQYTNDKGKAWGGITISDEKLMQLISSLISQTKWRGGMELELIKTPAGDYYLIEINPRIPAWVYLAVSAGQNIPETQVMLALGMEPPKPRPYKVSEMFIRYSYEIIVDQEKFNTLSANDGVGD